MANTLPKLELGELPLIEMGSPAWESISVWADRELKRLRMKREEPDADQRKLDVALGSILALTQLLELPELIRRERKRDPVAREGFDIPPPTGY